MYKVRSVAIGYTQNFGVDYFDTFAPVTKMNTIKIIISLAAHYSWDLHQYDVKMTY